jgi:hypothetical protein
LDGGQEKAMSEPLHFIFTDLPGPDGRCQFVEVETPAGKSVEVGTWHRRPDGLAELVVSPLELTNDNDPKAAIAQEIYNALEKLGAGPELLGIVGSYGDTLEDTDVLDMLKRFNQTGSMFDEVICRAYDGDEKA